MKTGVELIAEERQKQIEVEGWTAEHDKQHVNGELANAAAYYAMTDELLDFMDMSWGNDMHLHIWPFDLKWLKRTPEDRIRELQKAGAMIAADIDRIQNKCIGAMEEADYLKFKHEFGIERTQIIFVPPGVINIIQKSESPTPDDIKDVLSKMPRCRRYLLHEVSLILCNVYNVVGIFFKRLSSKGLLVKVDAPSKPNLVVINGKRYKAVDDTEDEAACADCSLLVLDCAPILCGSEDRADGRDVHFKPASS